MLELLNSRLGFLANRELCRRRTHRSGVRESLLNVEHHQHVMVVRHQVQDRLCHHIQDQLGTALFDAHPAKRHPLIALLGILQRR